MADNQRPHSTNEKFTDGIKPQWGARVPPGKIQRLYKNDALGLVDADLIDDVGTSLRLLARRGLALPCRRASGEPRLEIGIVRLHHGIGGELAHPALELLIGQHARVAGLLREDPQLDALTAAVRDRAEGALVRAEHLAPLLAW